MKIVKLGRLPGFLIIILFLSAACSNSSSGSDTDDKTDTGAWDTDSDTAFNCAPDAGPGADIVLVEDGALHGQVEDGVASFFGIPYAAPPVGELRWAPPSPHGCYEAGTFDADSFGAECPQLDQNGENFEGEEDCLTLNIWTPLALPASQKVPVLFFIHGGGNVAGSASETAVSGEYLYDGAELSLFTGSVVVTVQYRLGPLGFFTHESLEELSPDEVSGNYGIRDIIFALEWVSKNIGAFGGDSERVLVFGESAGALNTCMVLVSPLAAGLFSAALMQSGGCPGQIHDDALAEGLDLETAAGCSEETNPLLCLKEKTPAQLLEAVPTIIDVAGKAGPYAPHVDGVVLPEPPLDALSNGNHNKVPTVVGVNSDETSMSVLQSLTRAQYENIVNATFLTNADEVLAQYPVGNYNSPYEAYYNLTTDLKFVCTARVVARAIDSGQDESVYRYFFTEAVDTPSLESFGAFHGLELMFVFAHVDVGLYNPTLDETSLSEAIMNYWNNLATNGNPNGGDLEQWTPYVSLDDNAIVLEGGNIHMTDGIRTDKCDFWEGLYSWQ